MLVLCVCIVRLVIGLKVLVWIVVSMIWFGRIGVFGVRLMSSLGVLVLGDVVICNIKLFVVVF